MTSLLLLRFGRYLVIPALILVYTLGVGFAGYRWGRAGAELAHAEAQLDLGHKIRRADERIEKESPSQASIDTILKRLDRYAVDRDFSHSTEFLRKCRFGLFSCGGGAGLPAWTI